MRRDESAKDVLASFGLAALYAQRLEYALASSLVLLMKRPEGIRGPIDGGELYIEVVTDAEFQKPLGLLINRLKEVTIVPQDLEPILASALALRNKLMHAYLRDQQWKIGSVEGHKEMLAELEEAQRIFIEARELLLQALVRVQAIEDIRSKNSVSRQNFEILPNGCGRVNWESDDALICRSRNPQPDNIGHFLFCEVRQLEILRQKQSQRLLS